MISTFLERLSHCWSAQSILVEKNLLKRVSRTDIHFVDKRGRVKYISLNPVRDCYNLMRGLVSNSASHYVGGSSR